MVEKLKQEELPNFLIPINTQKYTLAVVGSGYVGLPTAALFAQAGFNVTAIDIRKNIVESVSKGRTPIQEPGLAKMILRNVQSGQLRGKLLCDSSFQEKNIIIITVQTPITEDKKPDLTFLMNAVRKIGPDLKKGMLIAVCSTVPTWNNA